MAFVSIGIATISNNLFTAGSVDENLTPMKFYNPVKISPTFSTIEDYTTYNSSILSTYTAVLDSTFDAICMKFYSQIKPSPNFSNIENYTAYSYNPISYIFWS